MRMEELADSLYIKSTDQVEKYLLNLIRLYFAHSNTPQPESREYVIERAVERMKEEITFDNMGVFSITLPDGEQKQGAVTITLEDLLGEPRISPKLSAFNVDFGNQQNTACEGNDPRLSDAREPLEHRHEIAGINGLEGQLSTLEGLLNRGLKLAHTHDNKAVLDMLTYSGNKTVIDLADLEKIQDEVEKLINDIYDSLVAHKKDIQDKIAAIDAKISEVSEKIEDLKQYILDQNKEWYDKAKQYTDEGITTADIQIQNKINDLVTKDQVKPVLDIANKAYISGGTVTVNINSIPLNTPTNVTDRTDVYTELNDDNALSDAIIECKIQGDGLTLMMPYIIMESGVPVGMVSYQRTHDNHVNILIECDELPPELSGSDIEINYLRTKTVTI